MIGKPGYRWTSSTALRWSSEPGSFVFHNRIAREVCCSGADIGGQHGRSDAEQNRLIFLTRRSERTVFEIDGLTTKSGANSERPF
jgi:hypothetical protein